MKARRRVEFTGVELAAPMKKAATGPVEKTATDLARAVIAPVEKAVRALEKAVVGLWHDGDGGRRAITLRHGGDAGRRALGCRGRGSALFVSNISTLIIKMSKSFAYSRKK
jgi:hypothetical protein